MQDLGINGGTSLKRQATESMKEVSTTVANGHEYGAKKIKNHGIADSLEVPMLKIPKLPGDVTSPLVASISTSRFIPSKKTQRETQYIWDQVKLVHGYDPDAWGSNFDEANQTSSCEKENLSIEEILQVLGEETDDIAIEEEELRSRTAAISSSNIERIEQPPNYVLDLVPLDFIPTESAPITSVDHSANETTDQAGSFSEKCENVSANGMPNEKEQYADDVAELYGQSSSHCRIETMKVQIERAGISGKVPRRLSEDPIVKENVGQQLKKVCRSFLCSKARTDKDCSTAAKGCQVLKSSRTPIGSDTKMGSEDEIEPAEQENDKVDGSISEDSTDHHPSDAQPAIKGGVDVNKTSCRDLSTDSDDLDRLRPVEPHGVRKIWRIQHSNSFTFWELVKKMKEEMSKDAPNLSCLRVWMTASFECRKNALISPSFELPRFLKKFPAMTNYQMLKEEYGRIHNDISKMSNLENELIADFQSVLAMRVRNTRKVHSAAREARMLWKDNPDSEMEKIYGMVCLAAHLGGEKVFEDLINLRSNNEEPNPKTMAMPTLNAYRSQLFDRSTEMWIYMDRLKYLKVPNIYEGVLCLHAIHWVFNIEYPNKFKTFLEYLDAKAGNAQSAFKGKVAELLNNGYEKMYDNVE